MPDSLAALGPRPDDTAARILALLLLVLCFCLAPAVCRWWDGVRGRGERRRSR